jgi:hypothetical protein
MSGRTLLIGNPGCSWREWLKEHRKGRPFLCLDPADPVQGVPGQLCLFAGGKPVISRFYGSLDAQRAPHLLPILVAQALESMPEDLIVQLFPYRPLPLLRHVTMLVAQLLRPTEILVANGTEIDQSGFPVGPSEIEIESAFPPLVQFAQRKALWLRLFEDCQKHAFDLRKASIEGVRLGTGIRLTSDERQKAHLKDVLYAERAGGTLFAVTDLDVEESDVAVALDFTGCTRAQFVAPGMYRNLLCSFAKQSGEDFGIGIITDIDWQSLRAFALSTAIAPAPIRILRIGALRVDSSGRELGEVRPWQV